ncbi:MAG TPA: hypothetical protein VFS09_03330 [Candidatus Eisenbacteria bacterium]|nr:hypothetical protein [Candidatus Eisenbacteria bacterium]
MRRGVVAILAIGCAVLLGATAVSYSKYKKSEAQFQQATADQADMQQRYDRAVNEIVSIQDSLSAIVLGPNDSRSVPPSTQLETPQTIHDTTLSRIAMLKSAIERTKERIEELDTRLKKSGVKIQGLEKMIAGLKNSVSEKEQQIASLNGQVDTLSTRVAGLSQQVNQQEVELTIKQDEITAKQHELATVFYAVGTKKELTTSGVVESKGGVLGFGKTVKPTGQFNEASFTPLDTDQENVIRIPAEKAQVISAQPATSYVIQPVDEKTVELKILNAEEFRKVKHVVILTT